MADPPVYPDSNRDTPRWVKVFGIVAVVVVLLFVMLHLTGEHGPGLHPTEHGSQP